MAPAGGFPPAAEWGSDEARRLISIAENRCDHIIAIERPGRASDGSCYTMRGICMDHLLAPLDKVIDLVKAERPGVVVTAIGDGGNELGMGKVYDDIIRSEKILMPDKCVAVRSCDNLIVASVSNWGGERMRGAERRAEMDEWTGKDMRAARSEATISMSNMPRTASFHGLLVFACRSSLY